MPIRKYGNEDAQVETRVEDNDPGTLSAVAGWAREDGVDVPRRQGSADSDRRDDDDGPVYAHI